MKLFGGHSNLEIKSEGYIRMRDLLWDGMVSRGLEIREVEEDEQSIKQHDILFVVVRLKIHFY